MKKIASIIKKEFIQVRRDRSMMAILFVVPIIQLLILGYIISAEVKNIQIVICDLDDTPVSRLVVERIRNSGYFNVRYFEKQENRLAEYLDSGKVSVALVLPRDLAKYLATHQPVAIQVLMDGQDSNTSVVALGYLSGILESFMTDQLSAQLAAVEGGGTVHLVTPSIRVWYNENLRNSDYMVPGIVVFLLTFVTSLVSAMGLVREREIGTLDQLLVAPVKKHQLLIGKIIPFAVLGFIEVCVALVFAVLFYRIPIVGNLGLFFLFTAVYLFTTLGIGLLVSASARTQQQAMYLTVFLLMFFLLMSGFLFPIENMPVAMRYLSRFNPMSYLILVVREIFIKGATLRHLYIKGVVLLVFGLIIFSAATLRFQSRMK